MMGICLQDSEEIVRVACWEEFIRQRYLINSFDVVGNRVLGKSF